MNKYFALLALIYASTGFAQTSPDEMEAYKDTPPTVVSFEDLKQIDESAEEKLRAVYPGDPSQLSIEVKQKSKTELEVSVIEPPHVGVRARKNLWAAGVVFNSIFMQGLNASYLHFNPKKDRVLYRVDATLSGVPGTGNFTLSYDYHLFEFHLMNRRVGVFGGVNGQIISLRNEVLAPVDVYIPAFGAEAGIEFDWTSTGTWSSTFKFMGTGIYFQRRNYAIKSFSISLNRKLRKAY